MTKIIHKTNTRRKAALTGLETAIILISFVIVAAAFSFAVLNLGLFTTQKSGEVVQAGIDEATSAIETVGSVIARSDLNGGSRAVANVTVFFKVAVGKRPIDLRVGSLVVTYHDSRTSIENVYTSNATAPVISFSSPGVIVKEIVGDGDLLIEFGELWSITVGINAMQYLQPTEVFTIQLKPVIGSVLKVERRLPPSLDPVMDLA
ncbi:MAG: hypothetical protein QW059_01365 [Nitrososphaerota archaeon]